MCGSFMLITYVSRSEGAHLQQNHRESLSPCRYLIKEKIIYKNYIAFNCTFEYIADVKSIIETVDLISPYNQK